jgi:type II secretory pathway pseudopilin PulG
MTLKSRRRHGFTLIEILVAMGLTIFILSILAECFIAGADLFRGLKAVGDLNASLRTATNILSSDLSADHFEGKRRLSDSKFWIALDNGPPKQGYFYLEQGNPIAPASDPQYEQTDADGIPSRRRTVSTPNSLTFSGCKLAMTVKARGYQPQNYFSASIPGGPLLTIATTLGNPAGRYQAAGSFSSQWVEVSYFLAPVQGSAVPVTASGTPLYGLYRQQRLIIASNTNTALNWTATQQIPGSYLATYNSKFSCQVNPNASASSVLYFNGPADVTIPERRAAFAFPGVAQRSGGTQGFVPVNFVSTNPNGFYIDASNNPSGEDLLLTDVLSFDIQVLTTLNTSDFADLPSPYYFDTWSNRQDDVYNYTNATTAVNPNSSYQILALKITLRVYDEKTQLARQITLIQDM